MGLRLGVGAWCAFEELLCLRRLWEVVEEVGGLVRDAVRRVTGLALVDTPSVVRDISANIAETGKATSGA